METAMFAASLAVVAAAAAGCSGSGGAGGAPTDASQDDFCTTFTSLDGTQSADSTAAEQIKAAKDAAAQLADTGTPQDMTDDERAGFEVFIDTVNGIDDGASQSELDNIDSTVSSADKARVDAFLTYTTKTCRSGS